MSKIPSILNATEEDIQLLLSATCHLGAKNLNVQMTPYVFKRRADGVHIINIGKTWEKLIFAARIICAIENPADVVVISARPYGQRAVLKYASYTGAQPIAGRFTPGTFTNYITRSFKEPRLIIVTDPRKDHQAIKEESYVNIPVIALADTDSPLRFIDVAIPTNNKAKHSIGLIYWLLAREVLRLRATIPRETPWDVMVDMFFYRDPEEAEKEAENANADNKPYVPAEPSSSTNWDTTNEWDATGTAATGGVNPSLAVTASNWDTPVEESRWDEPGGLERTVETSTWSETPVPPETEWTETATETTTTTNWADSAAPTGNWENTTTSAWSDETPVKTTTTTTTTTFGGEDFVATETTETFETTVTTETSGGGNWADEPTENTGGGW